MTASPPSLSMPEPRRRRSRWPILAVVVVVLVVLVALALSQGWIGGGTAEPTGPSASVEGVIPADAGVVAEGRAVPVRWSQVVPSGSGRVTAIPVAAGDTVAAGALLVQLDDAAAQLEIASAAAALDAATAAAARAAAGVDQAKAGVDQAKAGVDQAKAGVDQAKAARRSTSASLSVARAAVSVARAGLAAADAARDALPDTATKAQQRQADALVDQASAQLSQAQAGVDQAKAGVDQATAAQAGARAQLASARAALDAAQAALDAAQATLDAAEADRERARVAVAGAELARDHLAITSPIAGTVISIEPAVGDLVGPATVIARVADLGGWRFETADLSETAIARVHEGASATISVDGLPGYQIAGTVESVGGYGILIQGDITYRAVVVPSGPVPDGLRWNMTVTIEIDGTAAGG